MSRNCKGVISVHATEYKRAIMVILSGESNDGSQVLTELRATGGTDYGGDDAQFPSMLQ